jgi:ADP-ribosylglycohydrolase
MNKKQIQSVYGDGAVPFPDYQLNAHNRRWKRGDWTDDSDQMILIMETILELDGSLDERRYAAKLLRWINHGFPELGDACGMGLGATTAQVVHHPKFLQDPHAAAEAAWIRLNRNAAPNGAVMRTSVLGIFKHDDLDQLIANTVRIAKVTHYDSRCLASCVATTTAIAMMLQGHDVESDEGLQQLIDKAVEHGLKLLEPQYEDEFKRHIKRDASVASLLSLELDDATKIGYTFKCVGSGFWGLCASNDFKHMINLLVREGGDADTNGAVCGALWGARYGYSALPRDWLAAMPNKAWLDRKVVRFLNLLGCTNVDQRVVEKSWEEMAEEADTDDDDIADKGKKRAKKNPAKH